MLLVEITINSTLYRVSREGIALTNWWENAILSFDSPQLRSPKKYGGYAEMSFGTIVLTPELFDAEWPPPFSCPITVKYTATTEGAAETIFEGTCHLSSITREGLVYAFYGPEYDYILPDATLLDDTLDNIVAYLCDASRLNLTVDDSLSRTVSPDVYYTTTADTLGINLLSEICAYFTHIFYISGSTLYLIDMLKDNTSRTLTEFDYFPSEYQMDAPIASITDGTYTQASIYPYGANMSVTSYINTQVEIEAALDNIMLILNKFGCRIRLPLIGDIPLIGENIEWEDTSLGTDTDIDINCRAIQYNFDADEITIEGEGQFGPAPK